jgi:multiple sugar transport system substrate-binding protein
MAGLLFGLLAGCPDATPPTPVPPSEEPKAPLRVVVIDDPGLATSVARQWRARAEGELEIRPMTAVELGDPRRRRLSADAILYPSGLIGELAERDWIVPIESAVLNSDEFGRRDIFDQLRQHEIVWGEKVFAVPLGSAPFTLVYRPDVFQQLGVKPPATWQQYAEVSDRLSQALSAEGGGPTGRPRLALVEPLGNGWAGQMLLARAAPYARHPSYFGALFDMDTMEPLIASPPYVKALEGLVAAAKLGPAEAIQYAPADVRRLLRGGQCAMGVTWPSQADVLDETARAKPEEPILLAAAELPGSTTVYHASDQEWQTRDVSEDGHATLLALAGRLGSVVKGARQPQAAQTFLLRLSSKEWSGDISPHSSATTLYRVSQMRDAKSWVGDSFDADATTAYAELVRQTFRRSLWMSSVRIPGRLRYLGALDEAVQAAVRGDGTPAACLEQAAERWRQITVELGVEKQRLAYQRSLGIEP